MAHRYNPLKKSEPAKKPEPVQKKKRQRAQRLYTAKDKDEPLVVPDYVDQSTGETYTWYYDELGEIKMNFNSTRPITREEEVKATKILAKMLMQKLKKEQEDKRPQMTAEI